MTRRTAIKRLFTMMGGVIAASKIDELLPDQTAFSSDEMQHWFKEIGRYIDKNGNEVITGTITMSFDVPEGTYVRYEKDMPAIQSCPFEEFQQKPAEELGKIFTNNDVTLSVRK